jgi:hypothetical protein
MSNEAGAGFTPSAKPGKLTPAEFQQVASTVKDLLADRPLIKYSIYAAGVAGALDSGHWLWLLICFLVKSAK